MTAHEASHPSLCREATHEANIIVICVYERAIRKALAAWEAVSR